MKRLIVLLACFIIAACSDKREMAAGSGIIPKHEMTAILWDMMQVDEFATSFIARDSSKNLKMERIKLYQKVFSLHKVTDKDFSASFTYYSGHPELMKVVFDTLSARGERERQKMYLPDSARSR